VSAPSAGERTALVVAVPNAEPLVGRFRARHDPHAVARAIPPHVTVLFPFVPARELGAVVHDDVRALAARFRRFDAELARIATFVGHVWLAPEPREGFVDLLRGTYEHFPAFPPYGGAHEEPEPHLTVGEVPSAAELAAVAAAAQRELAPGLPLEFRVDALTLVEEGSDGTWRTAETFALASP
jgi:2'-5' RNA ligase